MVRNDLVARLGRFHPRWRLRPRPAFVAATPDGRSGWKPAVEVAVHTRNASSYYDCIPVEPVKLADDKATARYQSLAMGLRWLEEHHGADVRPSGAYRNFLAEVEERLAGGGSPPRVSIENSTGIAQFSLDGRCAWVSPCGEDHALVSGCVIEGDGRKFSRGAVEQLFDGVPGRVTELDADTAHAVARAVHAWLIRNDAGIAASRTELKAKEYTAG